MKKLFLCLIISSILWVLQITVNRQAEKSAIVWDTGNDVTVILPLN